MSAFPFTGHDRSGGQRGGLPLASLLVVVVVSALTGAVVAIVAQRILQRYQYIEVLPQPEPARHLGQPAEAEATVAPDLAAREHVEVPKGDASPLAPVAANLTAVRVAELERLLAEDDVIAGDGSTTCPPEFPIKANGRSGIYHWPGALAYAQTHPTLCFRSTEAADRAGFRAARR